MPCRCHRGLWPVHAHACVCVCVCYLASWVALPINPEPWGNYTF